MPSNIAEAKRINAFTSSNQPKGASLKTRENVEKLKAIYAEFSTEDCNRILSRARSFEEASTQIQLNYLRKKGIKLSDEECIFSISNKDSFDEVYEELQMKQLNFINKGNRSRNNNKNFNSHKKPAKETEAPKSHLSISRPHASATQNKPSVQGEDLEQLIAKTLDMKIAEAKQRLDKLQNILDECRNIEATSDKKIKSISDNLEKLKKERNSVEEKYIRVQQQLEENKRKFNASKESNNELLRKIAERVMN